MKRKLLCLLLALVLAVPSLYTPAGATAEPFSSVCAASTSSFAVTESGDLYVWGANDSGQLGDGTLEPRAMPYRIMGDVRSVSSATYFTLAVKTDNTLWGWGCDNTGIFGGEINDTTYQLTPVQLMEGIESVSSGYSFVLALRTDGTLIGWGSGSYGSLPGDKHAALQNPAVIAQGVKAFCAGSFSTYYVTNDGSLYAMGHNNYGQLGAGEDNIEVEMITPHKILDSVRYVSATGDHALAVRNDNTLWVWGDGRDSALGSEDRRIHYSPLLLMEDVQTAVAGRSHMMAVKTDGSLWAWGRNEYGQLGDGTTVTQKTPVQVMEDVAAVSSYHHTLILKTDGTLWTCGLAQEDRLQLGDGSTVSRSIPRQVMTGLLLPGAEPVERERQEGVSEWAGNAVEHFAARGLIPAEMMGDYGSAITRGEMAALCTLIYEYTVKNPTVTGEGAAQVAAGYSHAEPLRSGHSYGLFTVDSDFRPEQTLTRYQAAVFLTDLFVAIEQKEPAWDEAEETIGDRADLSAGTAGAVENAVYLGWIGLNGQSFHPAGQVSREEAVTMLYRQLEQQFWAEQSVRIIWS